MTKKILIHACCGPCAVAYFDGFLEDNDNLDFEATLLWHNPNIHPTTEYNSRKASLEEFAKDRNLDLIIHDYYGLLEHTAKSMQDISKRCAACYLLRLSYAAELAKERGMGYFTTTLLASPYQGFDQITRFGNKLADMHGLTFVVQDYRAGFQQSINKARKMGLYIQKYCGCIFSEEERYRKKKR